jgi:hypothetical protein
MTVGPPVTVCVTLLVKSRVPSVQLVLVIVPAVESMVVVPAALQVQVGDVLKLVAHCDGFTLTAGGSATSVQLTQVPFWQPPPEVHANAAPQPPQLFMSLCSLTHAPLHPLNPLLHVYVQAPVAHAGVALATPVEHADAELHVPFAWQVSTPVPEHVV